MKTASKRGLQGLKSNNAKVEERKSFLEFVDANSQPNGRRLDSRFTAISTPKPSDPNYERKMKTSLVGEFNRIQMELGKSTISSFSAAAWLRDDRPKVAIYPHQVDYCDFCAKVKKEIHAIQQTINRLHQSGSSSVKEITQSEDDKKEKTALLEEHLDQAKESMKYYREMKERCSTQWKKIEELEQLPTLSDEQRDELQH